MALEACESSWTIRRRRRPPGRDEKMWCRVLIVGSLVTLPVLAFFVLGRESASTAWLQMAIAKLTTMNNGTAGTVLLRVC